MSASRTPRRSFANYIEDWELTEIKKNTATCEKKNTATCETRSLEKVQGHPFLRRGLRGREVPDDPERNLEWKKGKGGGWQVIAMPDHDYA